MPLIEVKAYRIKCDSCPKFYSASKGKSKFHQLNEAFWIGLEVNGWKFDRVANTYLCGKCKG